MREKIIIFFSVGMEEDDAVFFRCAIVAEDPKPGQPPERYLMGDFILSILPSLWGRLRDLCVEV
jgi:hypothetical protein